jgi:glutamine amidotransferase
VIGIVDVGIGNQGSIREAVYALGHDPVAVRGAADLDGLSHLILPGVGAFRHAVECLQAAGLVEPVRQLAAAGTPLLGICIGMQLLCETGEEDGLTPGLALIPGRVTRLPETPGCRVPHVGWNEVSFPRTHPLFGGVREGIDFYFVHSYEYQPADPGAVIGLTEHGKPVVAAIARGNVAGVQFHPEKSQRNGLRVLENFCDWDGTC